MLLYLLIDKSILNCSLEVKTYSEDMPKYMVEFQGKLTIDYTLENMMEEKVGNMRIITCCKDEVLKDYLEKKYLGKIE